MNPRISCISVDIQTGHICKTPAEHYHHTSLLCHTVLCKTNAINTISYSYIFNLEKCSTSKDHVCTNSMKYIKGALYNCIKFVIEIAEFYS